MNWEVSGEIWKTASLPWSDVERIVGRVGRGDFIPSYGRPMGHFSMRKGSVAFYTLSSLFVKTNRVACTKCDIEKITKARAAIIMNDWFMARHLEGINKSFITPKALGLIITYNRVIGVFELLSFIPLARIRGNKEMFIEAVKELHDIGIVHNDLHDRNIGLSYGRAAIVDFEYSYYGSEEEKREELKRFKELVEHSPF